MKKLAIVLIAFLTVPSAFAALNCKQAAIDAAMDKYRTESQVSDIEVESAKKSADVYVIVLNSTEAGNKTYLVSVDTSDDQCTVDSTKEAK